MFTVSLHKSKIDPEAEVEVNGVLDGWVEKRVGSGRGASNAEALGGVNV